MNVRSLNTRIILLALVAAFVAACAPPKGQAEKLVGQIDAAMKTIAPDAQKYAAKDFAPLQAKITAIEGQFKSGDYSAVISAAPAALAALQDLAPKVAAQKAEALKKLDEEWSQLEVSVPADIDAFDALAKRIAASGKTPPGATPDAMAAAKAGTDQFRDFWKQAVDAKAAGAAEKAVEIGNAIRARLRVLTVELGGQAG